MGHDSSTILFAALTLLAALLWPVSPADAQTDRPRPLAHNPLQKWKLTWSDEFNGAGPVDPAKWVNMVGGQGWGNHELEYYTAGTENAEQRGGNLVITARDDGPAYSCWYGPCRYTSARLESRGLFSQKYGRFAARMKLPSGAGLWPAFWMLGDNITKVGWPKCGEIDIMEEWGSAPKVVRGSIHGPLPREGSYDVNKSFQLGPDLSVTSMNTPSSGPLIQSGSSSTSSSMRALGRATCTAEGDGSLTASPSISCSISRSAAM